MLGWFAEVEEISEEKRSAEVGSAQKLSVYFFEPFGQQKAEFSRRQKQARQHRMSHKHSVGAGNRPEICVICG